MSNAGTKRLTVNIDGTQATASLVQQALAKATANTTVSLSAAQAFSSAEEIAILNSAGTKPFNPAYNGAQMTGAALQQILGAAGTNTAVSVNTAQAFSSAEWSQISASAGSKKFSPDFNGTQTNDSLIRQVLTAAGTNTAVSVNTAQAQGLSDLISICETAGAKQLTLDINGAQASESFVIQVINAAETNTTVSVNTAQAFGQDDIANIVEAAGSKKLSLRLNGSQTSASYINAAMANAGTNTSITLDVAHALSASNLISFVQTAG